MHFLITSMNEKRAKKNCCRGREQQHNVNHIMKCIGYCNMDREEALLSYT